ncbi:MAG: ABC transporter ATP-binding protein [Bacillota bacterium]|nr:ABC transporter ATP-binding protein [Bacillota bacterium]
MEKILDVINLRKEYPGFRLQDISFSLPRGYIMGFIGPNGAGKSTTIKLIMNLVKKDGGKVRVFGRDNETDEQEIKQEIGFVYDENHYYEELTPGEIRGIIAPFYRKWDNEVFHRFLDRFELPRQKKLKNYSRGMKTKFSLAMALSHGASLVIMDEPTSGLDPVFRREILDILRDLLQDEQKSILFSTHITSDLDRVADYITFIHKGAIVFSDERESILESYGLVKGSRELLDGDIRKEFVGIRETSFGFEALTRDLTTARKSFQEQAVVEKATLEDIMLYTVKGAEK